MAKRVFKTDLSVKGIENLKKQLEDYKKDLVRKCDLLAQRLAEIGLTVAEAKVDESPLGKYVNLKVETSKTKVSSKAIIIAVGEIKRSEKYAPFSTLLAIEFGAGIYHNKIKNPKSEELGFGVGTFPNQIHAFEDGWYFWDEKEEVWRYTHGVRATMPMYNADIEIIKSIKAIAREVFG